VHEGESPRIVGLTSLADVVTVLANAFHADPLWGWIFPDVRKRREQLRRFLTLGVEGAMRYPWVWLTPNNSATSVWIPPAGTEYSDAQAERFAPLLVELLGPGAPRVIETFEMLNRSHPREEPHFFLSMLATDPDQSGKGHGLSLLADNLRLVDQEQVAVYLEASNEVNVPLYGRHGFEVVAALPAPGGGPEIFTMWRESTGH
jgi:GNAT superfamily N-acetyltransferase